MNTILECSVLNILDEKFCVMNFEDRDSIYGLVKIQRDFFLVFLESVAIKDDVGFTVTVTIVVELWIARAFPINAMSWS